MSSIFGTSTPPMNLEGKVPFEARDIDSGSSHYDTIRPIKL